MSTVSDDAAAWLLSLSLERQLEPSGRLPMKLMRRIMSTHLYYDSYTLAACALVCRRWYRQIGNVREWMDAYRPPFPDRFPRSIEKRIVAFLHDDKRSLSHFSFVSRDWCSLSREHLFHTIVLNSHFLGQLRDNYPPQTLDDGSPAFLAYITFAEMLEAAAARNLSLGDNIRELHIIGQRHPVARVGPASDDDSHEIVDPTPRDLVRILACTPHLEVLDLRNIYLDPDRPLAPNRSYDGYKRVVDALPISLQDIRFRNVVNARNAVAGLFTTRSLQQAVIESPLKLKVTEVDLVGTDELNSEMRTLRELGAGLTYARVDVSRLSGYSPSASKPFVGVHTTSINPTHLRNSAGSPGTCLNVDMCKKLTSFEFVIALHRDHSSPSLTERVFRKVNKGVTNVLLDIGEYESENSENMVLGKVDMVCHERLLRLERAIVHFKVPVEKVEKAEAWSNNIRSIMPHLRKKGKLDVSVSTHHIVSGHKLPLSLHTVQDNRVDVVRKPVHACDYLRFTQ